MARHFTHANTDLVTTSLGGAVAFGPGTIAAIVQMAVVNIAQAIMSTGTSNGIAFKITTAALVEFRVDGATSSLSTTTVSANKWYLLGFTKPTGSNAGRFHIYDFMAGTWVHEAGNTALANSSAPASSNHIGSNTVGTQNFDGDISQIAIWGTELADYQVESLALDVTPANWSGYAVPNVMWRLDPDPTVTVVDVTGGGANESSHSGTSITVSSDFYSAENSNLLFGRSSYPASNS